MTDFRTESQKQRDERARHVISLFKRLRKGKGSNTAIIRHMVEMLKETRPITEMGIRYILKKEELI